MNVGIQQAETRGHTCPAGRDGQAEVGRTHIQQAEAGEDSHLTDRGAQRLIPNRRRWSEIHTNRWRQVWTHPRGKDGWGHEPNRQRQMGTQQAETDGDVQPTGGDRWGHVLNRQKQKRT